MLAGFGLSTVCCIPYLIPLISPRHLTVYHLQGPASRLFVPALIYFGGFWLLFTAVLWVGQRSERVRAAFWTGAACMLPWFLAKSLAVFTGTTMPPGNSALLVTCGVAVVAVVAVAWREPPAWMRRPMHAAEVLFSLAAVSGVVLVAETLWCFYGARDLTREEPLRAEGGREGVARAAGAMRGSSASTRMAEEKGRIMRFEGVTGTDR